MSAARYRRREKRSSREEPVWDRSRRDGTAKRIHRSDSKLIFLSWADRLRSLEKNRGRLWRAFLFRSFFFFFFFFFFLSVSLIPRASSFSLSSFYGERQLLRPLPRRVVTTSDNTMAAALPTRLSRADRRERRSSGNYGLSRCALDNRPEDVRGYTRLSQCRFEISSRDDSSINRFWHGLARPSGTAKRITCTIAALDLGTSRCYKISDPSSC